MTAAAGVLVSLLMMSSLAQPAQDAQPTQDAPSAVAQSAREQASPPATSEGFDLARLKIDQCPGERFDFQAGQQTKVGLCGKAGASTDEIAKMLESAIAQLESTDRMGADARDQILAQIRAKLVEVRAR